MMKKRLNRSYGLILISLMVIVGGMEPASAVAQEARRVDEKATIDIVKSLLSTSNLLGADSGEKTWMEVDARTVALQTLEKNLSIMRSTLGKEVAELAVQEARAVFDPLFNFSISYAETHTYDRTETDQKWKKNTTTTYLGPGPDGIPNTADDEFEERLLYELPSPVEYLIYDKERPAGYYPTEIEASKESLSGMETSMAYGMAYFQAIPWGLELLLSLSVVDKEDYWTNPDDTWGSYDRPWKSTLTESLAIPLPWCRNFGRYAPKDIQLKLSRLSDEQEYWNAKAVINSTLLQADLAYWNLVSAAMNLNAVNGHVEKIERLLAYTQTLYDDRMATEYDLNQVKLELANVGEQQRIASNQVVQASNLLVQLMDAEKNTVFLPVGYASLLEHKTHELTEEALTSDMGNNPELKSQTFQIRKAELLLNQSQIQTRPDLSLIQRLTFTQGSSTYGLGNAWDSISEVFGSPDIIRQNYSLFYQYPLFNRLVKSNFQIAELTMEIEKTVQENLTNLISRDINDAWAVLTAAQARLKITENNLNLSRLAYGKALELQKDREITEIEIVNKSADLFNAELAFIQARIAQKTAEANLLAALGRIAETYALRTAHNDEERNRIHNLDQQYILHYFKEKTS